MIECDPRLFLQNIEFIREWSRPIQGMRDAIISVVEASNEVTRKPLRGPCEATARMFQRQREFDDKRRQARRDAEREVERVKEAARIHV